MEEKYFALGFSLIPKVGGQTLVKIRKQFESFELAWQCQNWEKFFSSGIGEKLAKEIISLKKEIDLEKEIALIEKEKIDFISFWDKEYPQKLKEISAFPPILYFQGDITIIQNKQLAVVGSRKITDYGKQVMEKILPEIIYAGISITSGMALGIDSLAHEITLENDGKTIAVLGSGLGEKIIRGNFSHNLHQKIISSGGLVLSELPPFFEATKFTFPARNRIISGLAMGTLIVEAAEKSGSLITASLALEQNREIFAIPGNIFSPQSCGTHKLIKEGAKCVTSSNDILEAFNFVNNFSKSKKDFCFEDSLEEKIHKTLSFEPMPIDFLGRKLKISSSELSSKLSMMELKGMIKIISGNRAIRN